MIRKPRYQQRLQRARVSRRRLLLVTLGSAGLAAMGIGCRGDKQPTGTQVSGDGEGKRGGILRIAYYSEPPVHGRGLDPHIQTAARAGPMRLIYQTLGRANPRTWSVEPELAQAWEFATPTELVLTLSGGVKFHNKPPVNGRAMKAEDVVYSLNRVQTPSPQFESRSLLDSVDKIEAVDASRIKLSLKLPDGTLVEKLTGFPLVVLAPEVVEKAGDKFTTADTAVGTGPFVLTELTETAAIHVRNPDYWKPGLPYADGVEMAAFGDNLAKWSAFVGGKLHAAQAPGTVGSRYSSSQGQFKIDGKFPAEWAADPAFWKVYVNTRREPFGDPRVYKALRLLLDHQEAADVDFASQYGRGYLTQTFGSSLAHWDFSQEEYITRFLEWKRPKDEAVREALRLLAAAGFTRERPLRFSLTTGSGATGRSGAQFMEAQWRQLSQNVVQVDIRLIDEATFGRVRTQRDFDVTYTGAPATTAEPDGFLRSLYRSDGARNLASWSDTKADQLIDRQRGTFDVEARKAIIKEILVYLIENAPAVVWSGRYTVYATQPELRGWAPENGPWTHGFQYEHVWLDS